MKNTRDEYVMVERAWIWAYLVNIVLRESVSRSTLFGLKLFLFW